MNPTDKQKSELEWTAYNFETSDHARNTGLFGVRIQGISSTDLSDNKGGVLIIKLDEDGSIKSAKMAMNINCTHCGEHINDLKKAEIFCDGYCEKAHTVSGAFQSHPSSKSQGRVSNEPGTAKRQYDGPNTRFQ